MLEPFRAGARPVGGGATQFEGTGTVSKDTAASLGLVGPAARACAISGGPYAGYPEVCDGAGTVVPVGVYVPGCPPHPVTLLDGLLRLPGSREPVWRVSS